MRSFERFKLPYQFFLPAFSQGSFHGSLEFVDVHRFRETVVRAAWSLQRANLLMHFKRSGNNYDRDKRKQFFEFRQKIESQFAIGKNVIEDEYVGALARNICKSFGPVTDADQFVLRECLLINFELKIIVLNDQNRGSIHTLLVVLFCFQLLHRQDQRERAAHINS